MDALGVAACPDEAERFFAYLSMAAATSLGRGVDSADHVPGGGERDLSERELAPPGRLAGQYARCAWTTGPGPSARSTCTAKRWRGPGRPRDQIDRSRSVTPALSRWRCADPPRRPWH